ARENGVSFRHFQFLLVAVSVRVGNVVARLPRGVGKLGTQELSDLVAQLAVVANALRNGLQDAARCDFGVIADDAHGSLTREGFNALRISRATFSALVLPSWSIMTLPMSFGRSSLLHRSPPPRSSARRMRWFSSSRVAIDSVSFWNGET